MSNFYEWLVARYRSKAISPSNGIIESLDTECMQDVKTFDAKNSFLAPLKKKKKKKRENVTPSSEPQQR